MNNVTLLNENWILKYNGENLKATVPNDVTLDLYANGKIKNPYFGINHKDLHWITDTDFEYVNIFDVPDNIFNEEEILLGFDGIDTFSEITLNGTFLGKTENMFLKYSYSVKDLLKKSGNELVVKMLSTNKKMEEINDEGYFGVFNTKRLFIRKAQCHFGWDWAPDMQGYGICGDVSIRGVKRCRLDNVHYRAFNDGNISLFVDLNYTIRPQMDSNGRIIKESDEELKKDVLRYTVASEPLKSLNEAKTLVEECLITGKKNFKNFYIKNPSLWYPAGYGEQPLYEYKVELIRGGEVIDEITGYFALMEVKLEQRPTSKDTIGYRFIINGVPVFIKGSNWTPAECFIGSVKDEKYYNLIKKAKDANFNMLRVWGGGIYEKDVFYDICDKLGILVWQDFMFACADIPEDNAEFMENVKKEVTYQVKRLRNHPSIIYWCGGNEKTGTYGLQISRGDYFVDVFLRGLILNLDESRPYARQSPCSLTDVGNDKTTGESHAGCFEACLERGIENYREVLAENVVPFVSECAIMGPCSLQGLKRMFPEDKIWPMNEYWADRLMDNPYSSVLMDFPTREKYYAEFLYGECKNVRDFIAKGMTAHAETLRAEIEYARFNKEKCGGFMNWMYSDIWPSATWAVVDYYLEPKQAYYQMKKSYAPVLLTYVYTKEGLNLAIINDTRKSLTTKITYGEKTTDGKVLFSEVIDATVGGGSVFGKIVNGETQEKNSYLFAEAVIDGEKITTVFSSSMWKKCKFKGDYTYTVKTENGKTAVTFKANSFVKGIGVSLPDNYKYEYTDNYFDMQKGEQKTVYISAIADEKAISVTDFSKETI